VLGASAIGAVLLGGSCIRASHFQLNYNINNKDNDMHG